MSVSSRGRSVSGVFLNFRARGVDIAMTYLFATLICIFSFWLGRKSVDPVPLMRGAMFGLVRYFQRSFESNRAITRFELTQFLKSTESRIKRFGFDDEVTTELFGVK
jgi:hypothetical protein